MKNDSAIKAPKMIENHPNKGEEKTVSQRLAKSKNIPRKGAATKIDFASSGRLAKVKSMPIIKKSIERANT